MALIDRNILRKLDNGGELSQDDMTRIMSNSAKIVNEPGGGGRTNSPQTSGGIIGGASKSSETGPSETGTSETGTSKTGNTSSDGWGFAKGVAGAISQPLGVAVQGVQDLVNQNPYGVENFGVGVAGAFGGKLGSLAMEGFIDVTGLRVDDKARDKLEDEGYSYGAAKEKVASIDRSLESAFDIGQSPEAERDLAKDVDALGRATNADDLGTAAESEMDNGYSAGEFGESDNGDDGESGGDVDSSRDSGDHY